MIIGIWYLKLRPVTLWLASDDHIDVRKLNGQSEQAYDTRCLKSPTT